MSISAHGTMFYALGTWRERILGTLRVLAESMEDGVSSQ